MDKELVINRIARELRKLKFQICKLSDQIEGSDGSQSELAADIQENSISIDALEAIPSVKTIDSLTLTGNTVTLSFTDKDDVQSSVDVDLFTIQQAEIKNNVLNFSQLSTITNPDLYEFAYVRESQGTQWLPSGLGGTYYGSGLYMWDGTEWIEDDTEIFNQLEQLIDNINLEIQQRINADTNLQNQLDNLSQEDISRDTFEQFLDYVKKLDPNPTFSYTAGLLTSITYNWNSNQTILTLAYDGGGVLQTLTLSGDVEVGINTIKTLNYTAGNLTSITYS